MGLVPLKEGHCNGGMAILSLQWYYYEWHRRIAKNNSESKKCSLPTLLVPSVYSQRVFLLILSSRSVLGGWGGGVVCTIIFVSNPTTVLRLCCVVVGVVTIVSPEENKNKSTVREW